MRWYHYLAYFFGGAFLANALPHLGNGISGHAFQSPFASPPGVGLSSSTVNVLWGLFNLAVAYLLVCRVGSFNLRSTRHVLVLGAGILIMSLNCAHYFGQSGWNSPPNATRKSFPPSRLRRRCSCCAATIHKPSPTSARLRIFGAGCSACWALSRNVLRNSICVIACAGLSTHRLGPTLNLDSFFTKYCVPLFRKLTPTACASASRRW